VACSRGQLNLLAEWKPDRRQTGFHSPHLVAGRFHLWKRLGLSIGAGEQMAITHFHQYNHAKTVSVALGV
jgi:hypothetical protein